ncbi:MAG TPA: o-succinylbenzoate synthase [Pyrinomonadaceae bacterium]|nr:o-succinylbenzoate synthase [Pyrinomonadaceae bacterium]
MIVEAAELREIHLPLRRPFETSLGVTTVRRVLLAKIRDVDGAVGWGECTADEDPFYSAEWTESAWAVSKEYLAPLLLGRPFEKAADVWDLWARVRGHRMAKAALETAVWDLEARRAGIPLWKHLGGVREEIACGVSLGIQKTPAALFANIDTELEAGYQRIKIKIKPGWDAEITARVRARYPDVLLSVDANSAYTLADIALFRGMDELGLLMIEQPFDHDDLHDHARLQSQIQTPLCLDESIESPADGRKALESGACRIINIKLGRVGGFTQALALERICRERSAPVWCGGMLETGVGRAHNIALSTLAGFTLPGDVSASERYWETDVIEPPVTITSRGTITPPERPGLGYEIDEPRVAALAVRTEIFSAK